MIFQPHPFPTPGASLLKSPHVRWATRLLLVLLVVDGVFITLHVLASNGWLTGTRRFLITREQGYGELFQYVKTFAAATLLWRVSRHQASLTALTWAVALAAILIDDAFAVHEWLGRAIGVRMFEDGALGMSAAHQGELLFLMLGATGVLVAVAGTTWLEGPDAHRVTKALAGAVALLATCGILVDAIHSLLAQSALRGALIVIEDGGEMLAMSAIVAIAFQLWIQARASRST